jgi:hypothetical protein
VTTPPRDELSSGELLSSGRGRLAAVGLVALMMGAFAIAALRPDRQGVGTPVAGSPSAVPSASPSDSPSPSPSPSPAPSPSPKMTYGPAPVPPPLSAKTGARLLVVQGTRLEMLAVDSGRRTVLPTSRELGMSYDRLDVVAVGERLVLVGDNNTGAGSGPFDAYATRTVPGSTFRVVGQASYLVRSVHPDRVWLVAEVDTNDADSGSTLTEVDVRGVVHQRVQFRHAFAVRPFAGGFLRWAGTTTAGDAGDPGTDLVDARGRRLRNYPGVVRVVSGSTAVLVQNDLPCTKRCPLLVLTADGTRISQRTVYADAMPGLMEPALTRDASRLFTSVIVEGGDNPPSKVTEMDLRTGRARELRDAWAETYYGASFVFSPDGRWMFFSDVDAKHVDAYDLTSRRTFRVEGTFGTITQLELLPG